VEAGARAAGRPVARLGLPPGGVIGLIIREDQVLIPRGATVIQPGDEVLLFLKPEVEPRVQPLFRGS